jgi:hypothetical protein
MRRVASVYSAERAHVTREFARSLFPKESAVASYPPPLFRKCTERFVGAADACGSGTGGPPTKAGAQILVKLK